MADKKISQLTSATTPLAGTEELPIVQGGNTVKVNVNNLTAGKAVAASQLTIENNSSSNAVRITQTGSGNALVVEDSANPDATPFVVDSSGNLLVGTTAENGKLSVVGNQVSVGSSGGSDSLGIQIKGTTISAIPGAQVQSYVATGNSSMGIAGDLIIAPRTDVGCSVRFIAGTTPAERMQIASNGDITAFTGNLVVGTAGKGIDFSANTHATGMTKEVLDWYEEGNYTPTVASTTGAITSYTATAYYTRIGRQITLTTFVTITDAGTGAGSLTITLPFTASGSIAFAGTGRENALTGDALQANISAGGTVVNVVRYNNTTVIATNAQVRSTVTYFV